MEQTAWVRVDEPFKGAKQDELLVLKDVVSSCSYGFQTGARLLFYLYPGKQPGVWSVPSCHRTTSLESAAADLHFLRHLPGSAKGTRLSGEVSFVQEDSSGLHKVRDLPGLRVTIRNVATGEVVSTTTDAHSMYEVYQLAPGNYSVGFELPPGIGISFPMITGNRQRFTKDNPIEVTLDPDEGLEVSVVLREDNVLSGRLLSHLGEPMDDVCISAVPATATKITGSRSFDCTKNGGRYRISELPSGQYRLVINPSGSLSVREPFGTWFYPGVTDQQKATLVTIEAGQHRTLPDFRTPPLAKTIELSGILRFSDGTPVSGGTVQFQSTASRYGERTNTGPDGRFSLRVMAGHAGRLEAQILVFGDVLPQCPQFPGKLNPRGFAVSLTTPAYDVAGDANQPAIPLAFSFPSCPHWPPSR